MASPLVAGVISLISAANPSLSMIQARAVLLSTGRPLESLKGAVITGSLVDANAAVAQARRTQAQVRVAGYVRTRSKRGVSGATVTLTSSSSGATVSRSVTTASDGSYSFNELPLGSYLLKARKSRLQFTAVSFQASSLKLFKRNLDAR